MSKVESFESLLGFHSVDAGFVALVLFDFLLFSWWYSLLFILVIIHEQWRKLIVEIPQLLCYQLPKRKSWKTGLLTPPKGTAAARAVRLIPRLGYNRQGQVRFHPFCGWLRKFQ